jgi:hypothetical protein
MSLTHKEKADVAVACLKMFVDSGCKVSLESAVIFSQAKEGYNFVMGILSESEPMAKDQKPLTPRRG